MLTKIIGWNFMNKSHVNIVLTALVITFPIAFVIMLGMLMVRTGNPSNTYYEPYISIEDALEGTAYLDILVKMKPSSY